MTQQKKYNIEPIGDRVFVKRGKAEATTDGGIALPDIAQEHSRIGTVVAVGPGALRPVWDSHFLVDSDDPDRFPMQCKTGDCVLLPHTAEIIKLYPNDPNDEVVVCSEQALLAILR